MSAPLRRNAGVIQIVPLLVVIVILLLIVVFGPQKILERLTPVSTPTPSQTPSLTPTPTPTPTPKPKVTTSPTPSVSPTSKPLSGPPSSGYSVVTVSTEKGNFSAKIVSIDLGGARMITDTANDDDCFDNCPVLPLSDYVARNGGFAGVNGTYFCPETYPECSGKKNSYDFPVYNTRLGKWINARNLSWNGRAMVYYDGGGIHYLQNANSFGGGLTAGIINYPGLLEGGNVQIDDNQSGLSDKQKTAGTKVGIGVRGTTNAIIVVAYNVTMQQFAYVFKALGATGALNLDTGGSTALWFGGYKAGPGRNIPNAIIFASK